MLESGQHLTIDLYGSFNGSLLNEELIELFLNQLPLKIGMTVIREAETIDYKAEDPRDSGITGFVILAESHCSIHAFPARNFAYIDVFSCKSFDVQPVLDYIKEIFDPEDAPYAILKRGTDFS